MKKGNSIPRMIIMVISFAIQITWILLWIFKFQAQGIWAQAVIHLLAIIFSLWIVGRDMNEAFKIPWLVFIGIAPMIGLTIYLLFGQRFATKRSKDAFNKNHRKLIGQLQIQKENLSQLEDIDMAIANQFRFLEDKEGYPLYRNTDLTFYAQATEGLEAQLVDLQKAQDFIFMDYHAIEDDQSFSRIAKILAEKAKMGVEVRLMYDEVGSLGFINRDFIEKMKKLGIQCKVFNPLNPFLNIFVNNRDHRKITVIDGKVGFTGGYNLANEYFNIDSPYGYWKDTGLRLEGDAVQSLTASFLEMWHYSDKKEEDYGYYLKQHPFEAKEAGFISPYADTPTDQSTTGEDVYLNALKQAKESIYIATPYLIISDEMNRELTMAARRGVDVHIITPGIPDKKLIYRVTRSYYTRLVANGVHIHEYTPGFIHQKQVLVDHQLAMVGTINLDFRSLYHHFENGVLFYGYHAIETVKADFEKIIAESRDVSFEYKYRHKSLTRFTDIVLRLLAPLF